MKINEIIKERRTAKKLTQEQMAAYLGVTAPAVNKWEKGMSYPDITLLPALARLLDTDLNTLLSFQDDMSEKEIGLFMNYLAEMAEKEGIDKVFDIAQDKIRQFPTCYPLILKTATLLEGLLVMNMKIKGREEYQNTIEALYRRALDSQDSAVRNQAKAMLISKYRKRKEYEQAQELLDSLPDKDFFDKKQLQIGLWIETGDLGAAAKMAEEQMLLVTSNIYNILMLLLEIAIKENRMEDAEYIANVSKNSAKLFDLWEYNSYAAHALFYSATKQRVKAAKVMSSMLKSLTRKWNINQSPLYRHIQTKEADKTFGSKLQEVLIDSIRQDEDTAYILEEPEIKNLLNCKGNMKDDL